MFPLAPGARPGAFPWEPAAAGSPEVEFGRSLREWLHRLGIPQGGKSIKEVPFASKLNAFPAAD